MCSVECTFVGGPVHDAAELVPVVDVLEIEQLHRRAGDDHAVVATILDLVECGVERLEVLLGDVFGRVAGGLQQLDLDLQRGVGQLAQDLRLGRDLGGHEIEQQHVQRADVLVHGAMLGHHEDVLVFEHFGRGQGVGDLDGHGRRPSCCVPGRSRLAISVRHHSKRAHPSERSVLQRRKKCHDGGRTGRRDGAAAYNGAVASCERARHECGRPLRSPTKERIHDPIHRHHLRAGRLPA